MNSTDTNAIIIRDNIEIEYHNSEAVIDMSTEDGAIYDYYRLIVHSIDEVTSYTTQNVAISKLSFFSFITSSSYHSADFVPINLKDDELFWKNLTDDDDKVSSYDVDGSANDKWNSYYFDGSGNTMVVNGEWIQFNEYSRSTYPDASNYGQYMRLTINGDRPKPKGILLLGSDSDSFDDPETKEVFVVNGFESVSYSEYGNIAYPHIQMGNPDTSAGDDYKIYRI